MNVSLFDTASTTYEGNLQQYYPVDQPSLLARTEEDVLDERQFLDQSTPN
jgi:hypothetical protein